MTIKSILKSRIPPEHLHSSDRLSFSLSWSSEKNENQILELWMFEKKLFLNNGKVFSF